VLASQLLIDQAVADGFFSHRDRHVPGAFQLGPTTCMLNAGHVFNLDALRCRSLSDGMMAGRRLVQEYVAFYRRYVPGFEYVEHVTTASLMGIRSAVAASYALPCDNERDGAAALAQSKEARVREMFAQIAPTYDLLNTILSLGLHHGWRRAVLRCARLAPGSRVLDLATGTADLALAAARQVAPGGAVVGTDFCAPILRLGQRKVRARAAAVRLVVGSASALPFADGTFDAVLMAFALRNVPSVAGALAEMTRVTRPGGWVVNLELTRPTRRWLQPLYRLYQDHLMPLVGGLISGRREAYTYLPQSIQGFPAPAAIAEVCAQVGLAEVTWQSLSGGLATLHSGRKP
jgi:demethylmenaquinone methyltransferase/2-methoxy-6-polyprenyl-1,4-benzoquinol methylase